MIRLVIADDHTIVREGLRQLLGGAGGFDVVGEARDGPETMQRVRELEFDVLLLDMSMPGRAGMDLIRQVRAERPRLRILVLSMHQEHQYAIRAIRAGASGYLTKESASRELATALRKVASGGAYITPEVAEQLALGAMPSAEALPHTTLSDREFQVLRMLVAGKSVSDIAADLTLSVKTVSTHKARLMQKLGVSNTSEMFRYALQHRLVDDVEPGPAG
jgi:DNA-binding NarL/FixJ family response regulator